MRRRLGLAVAAFAAAILVAAPGASASRYLQTGLFDDAQILWGNPDKVFPLLKSLNTQVIRVNLYWGGPNGVAKRRPASPTDPSDPAYNWATYDRTVYASEYGINVVLSIVGHRRGRTASTGRTLRRRTSSTLASSPRRRRRATAASSRATTAASCQRCAPGSSGTGRTTRSFTRRSTRRWGASGRSGAAWSTRRCATRSSRPCAGRTAARARSPAVSRARAATTTRARPGRPSRPPVLRAMKAAGAGGLHAYAITMLR